MKTIYFVRHGESEANAAGIAAGGGLDSPLNDHGRQQAQQIAGQFKGKGVQMIVSSPMKRAYETATIIAQNMGFNSSSIVTNELWVERQLGELTGVPKEQIKMYYDMGRLPASAESTERLHTRITQALDWMKTLEADTIILVSHGGVGRMLRAIYRDEHHESINSLGRTGNAEILEFHL